MDRPISESGTDFEGPAPKAARPKTKAAPGPVAADSASHAAETVKLFAAALGDLSNTMASVAADSVNHASPSGRELVVDVAAVVTALLSTKRQTRVPTAAAWLQEWAQTNGLAFGREFNAGDTAPLRLALSITLRTGVLPRAVALRDATMGGMPEPVGVRHLLFALAEQPAAKWPVLTNGRLTNEMLADLRRLIVERTGVSPRKGEDMAIWRDLLEGPTAAAASPPGERTPLLSDSPAAVDELGRKPLADALATRLARLQRDEAASAQPKAVMVHLHGPWGSGKSSLVRFLEDTLKAQDPPWLVVEFNAWRNARVKPPWWNMLTEFKRALDQRLPWWRRRWLDLRWAWVSPSVDNVSLVMAGLVAALLLLMFGAQLGDLLKAWQTQLGVLTALFTVIGLGRSQLLGGKRVAESFDALRTDSFRPFITLFDMLVKECPCPVLIVLDDLDRCDAGTVTDLLEGIQTLFRGQPVVFLAVADRYWITASFAQRFSLFEDGGDKARPVGDLFLDKMFQVSVTIPALPVAVKRAYLSRLLGAAESTLPDELQLPATAVRHEEIQAAIAAAPEEQRPALRAQAVARLSTPAADKAVEHRLLRWVSYIEPNPRGMKRLVNAIGMTQARSLLEGRMVDFDAIVLWTILELRWPRAAAAITADPGLIDAEGQGSDTLQAAWRDPLFQKIAGELDEVQVRALIGTADEDDEDAEVPA
jgi:hypothetical protein